MPFKIKYEVFKNAHNLKKVVQRMETTDFGDVKKNYRVKRLVDKLESEQKVLFKLHQQIQAEIDWTEDKRSANNAEEIEQKMRDLYDIEVECQWEPLNEEEFLMLNPTSGDMRILEFITAPVVFDGLQS